MAQFDAVYCSEQIEVPTDLPAILKGFTKECIRYNPDNLVAFAREYFSALQDGDIDEFLGKEFYKSSNFTEYHNAIGIAEEQEEDEPVEGLDPETQKQLKAMFIQLDADKSGGLDAWEIAPLAASMEVQPWELYYYFGKGNDFEARITLEDLYNWARQDGTEKQAELEALPEHKPHVRSQAELDQVNMLWKNYDADDSGVLDFKEFTQLCKDIGVELWQAHKQFDKDGDMSVQKEEFMNWWFQEESP